MATAPDLATPSTTLLRLATARHLTAEALLRRSKREAAFQLTAAAADTAKPNQQSATLSQSSNTLVQLLRSPATHACTAAVQPQLLRRC
jgi:hypothetical protein